MKDANKKNPFKEWFNSNLSDDDEPDWELVDVKDVLDSDGFITDYALYKNADGTKFITMFGDTDIYEPDEGYADMEFDSVVEAKEWFENYKGLMDDEDEDEDSFADFDEGWDILKSSSHILQEADEEESEEDTTNTAEDDTNEKDEIDLKDYKKVTTIDDYDIYRKIIKHEDDNSIIKGVWAAQKGDEEPFSITYEQSTGEEPIEEMQERFSRKTHSHRNLKESGNKLSTKRKLRENKKKFII